MVEKPEVLAIIPARGGSKGIPGKNIRDFAGFPLIAYSIAAARQSESVTRVIVSTDSPEISDIALKYGAEVPFIRPASLAEDTTLDLPVFLHALNWLAENEDYRPDLVVQLRPTSPIRPLGLIDCAVMILNENPEADSVRGVVPAGQNPHKMWRISTDGKLTPLLTVAGMDEPYNAPRQSLPPVYWQTGHIDVIRPDVIIEKGSMSGDVILPVLIDTEFMVDIDNLDDWARYEWVVREKNLDMVRLGLKKRTLPEKVSLVVFDFDGVMTDDRVWLNQAGEEFVAANRSDGAGIRLLLDAGFKAVIISTEVNPVVASRAKKIGLPYFQGIGDKRRTLLSYLDKEGISENETVYVGNDLNDLHCFPVVAFAVAVADAHKEVVRQADHVLSKKGGYGAVREVCDIILKEYGNP